MNEADKKAFEEKFPRDHYHKHDMVLLRRGFQAACEWRDSQVGEPVAYYTCEGNWPRVVLASDGNFHGYETPLYTTPPTAQINQQLVEALERLINVYSVSHSPETRANCWEQAKVALQAARIK